MDFLDDTIAAYCQQHTSEEPHLLRELNRDTNANVLMPRMLAGHLQGRFIAMISHMIRPAVVVEIGTYTGYSALCWAEGLTEGGIVHTIEVNDELEARILRYIKASSHADKIQLHIGQALDVLDKLDGPIDVVYIDADKENYWHYFQTVVDKVRKGGFVIADNVLWSGKVIQPDVAGDSETKAIKEFNERIHTDPRVEHMLLPLRDGLMITRKI